MRKQFYVVADNIRSLENIGSIFRTADALSIDKVFLCGISGTPVASAGRPPAEKISKAALGAEKWVPWEYHRQTWRLVEQLKRKDVFVVCLEQTKGSISYEKFKPKFPIALVLGNEVNGISQSVLQRADSIIQLPMHGKKESLNVAVAFGVAGYEINRVRS